MDKSRSHLTVRALVGADAGAKAFGTYESIQMLKFRDHCKT